MTFLAFISLFQWPITPNSGIMLTRLFQEGETVAGSTDSILLMGIVIVLIVVMALIWTRRKWTR